MNFIKSNSGVDALILAELLYHASEHDKWCSKDFYSLCNESITKLNNSGIPFFASSKISYMLAKCITTEQMDSLTIKSLIEIISDDFLKKCTEKLNLNYTLDEDSEWYIGQVDQHWEKFIDLLKDMEKHGYQETWEKDAKIFVEQKCEELNKSIHQYNVDGVLKYMARMKHILVPENYRMYMSYYSPNFSFGLGYNMSVQNIHDLMSVKYLLRVIAHEFLHGFLSIELAEWYEKAKNEDLYMKDVCTDNVWYSGNEEEFVKAAEHFIVYKAGLYSLEDIINIQEGLYGNSLFFRRNHLGFNGIFIVTIWWLLFRRRVGCSRNNACTAGFLVRLFSESE